MQVRLAQRKWQELREKVKATLYQTRGARALKRALLPGEIITWVWAAELAGRTFGFAGWLLCLVQSIGCFPMILPPSNPHPTPAPRFS